MSGAGGWPIRDKAHRSEAAAGAGTFEVAAGGARAGATVRNVTEVSRENGVVSLSWLAPELQQLLELFSSAPI